MLWPFKSCTVQNDKNIIYSTGNEGGSWSEINWKKGEEPGRKTLGTAKCFNFVFKWKWKTCGKVNGHAQKFKQWRTVIHTTHTKTNTKHTGPLRERRTWWRTQTEKGQPRGALLCMRKKKIQIRWITCNMQLLSKPKYWQTGNYKNITMVRSKC